MNRQAKQEQLLRLLEKQDYICAGCAKRINTADLAQRAHLAAQTKANRKEFGRAVDDDCNVVAVCSLLCNNAVAMSKHKEQRWLGNIYHRGYK